MEANLTIPQTMDEPPAHLRAQEKLFLLDLPLEILQLVAWHFDVTTFYISLLTCKKFMEIANSKRLILHHLKNHPGLIVGLEHQSTSYLLTMFRKRAADSLCGAGILADVKSYASTHCGLQTEWTGALGTSLAEHPKLKGAGNAELKRCKVSKPVFSLGPPAQIAMANDLGIIRVFQLGDRRVRLASELFHQSLDPNDKCGLAVLQMAFSSTHDLAVLYQPLVQTKDSKPSPFYQSTQLVSLIVVIYRSKLSPTGEVCYSIDEQETTDIIALPHAACVGLALAPNGNVCIAWQSELENAKTELWLLARVSNETDPAARVTVLRDPGEDTDPSAQHRLIFHMNFIKRGHGLIFFGPGNPVHSWYTYDCDPEKPDMITGPSRCRSSFVDVGGKTEGFEIGMPFRGFHHSHCTFSAVPTRCRYSYFAIGISTTVFPATAFIFQWDISIISRPCQPVDLDYGRRQKHWKPVAFLAGWRLCTSSLGTVMAISPGGNRIAAATWDCLLIWTWDANLIYEGALQYYFPARDYNTKSGIGRLRPTKLLTDGVGVIYRLLWASETSLFASTEHGLVQWDMGIFSTGERQTLSLDQAA